MILSSISGTLAEVAYPIISIALLAIVIGLILRPRRQ